MGLIHEIKKAKKLCHFKLPKQRGLLVILCLAFSGNIWITNNTAMKTIVVNKLLSLIKNKKQLGIFFFYVFGRCPLLGQLFFIVIDTDL